jgi:hypothetical protein
MIARCVEGAWVERRADGAAAEDNDEASLDSVASIADAMAVNKRCSSAMEIGGTWPLCSVVLAGVVAVGWAVAGVEGIEASAMFGIKSRMASMSGDAIYSLELGWAVIDGLRGAGNRARWSDEVVATNAAVVDAAAAAGSGGGINTADMTEIASCAGSVRRGSVTVKSLTGVVVPMSLPSWNAAAT